MKIILTGATGTIGSHALNAALSSPKVTSIIALSRRALAIQDPKLNVIIHNDISSYLDSILDQLADADACLFCMGMFTADQDVNYEYPLALAKALAGRVKQQGTGMIFVYLSGALGEGDLLTRVMGKGDAIRVKGRTEKELLDLAQRNEKWQTIVAKPGGVLERGIGGKIMSAISGKD